MPGGSTVNKSPITHSPHDGGSNRSWNFISTNSGYYQIKNANSGLDLNVAGSSTANRAKIVQWQFGSLNNDQWFAS